MLRQPVRSSQNTWLLPCTHRLLSAILRVSEVESRAIRADLTHLLSPQMGKDIVWFLKRWARTYLLVDEKLYDQVRRTLHLVLSHQNGAGLQGRIHVRESCGDSTLSPNFSGAHHAPGCRQPGPTYRPRWGTGRSFLCVRCARHAGTLRTASSRLPGSHVENRAAGGGLVWT